MPPTPQDNRPDPDRRLDAERILESITDAFFTLDTDWRFTYVNAQAERVMARTRQGLLGRRLWDEFPEAAGTLSETAYRCAMDERAPGHFEQFYPPLDAWFDVRAFPDPGGIAVFFRDISDRKRAENALRAAEDARRAAEDGFRDAQTRLGAALAAGGIAAWSYALSTRRVAADPGLVRLFDLTPAVAAGGRLDDYLQAVHPDDRARVAAIFGDGIAGQRTYEIDFRVPLPGGADRSLVARGRVERDAAGRAVAFDGVVADVTEAVERRRREQFLAELSERARRLADPAAVIADAVRSLGLFLGLSRCAFADIDAEADRCTITDDFRADDTVASQAGTFPISAYGPFILAEFAAGRTVVVEDARADPLRVPPDALPAYEAFGIRAHVTAPVVHSARLVSVIGAHSAAPRRWAPEEVALIQAVVERTWLTVAVARQNRALEREAAATARVLESITDGLYVLDRDWRFTYVNASAERMLRRPREELLGRRVWDEFPEAVGTVFDRAFRRAVADGLVAAVEDYYAPLDAWLDVRAYPSPDGLSVFFQDVSARHRADAALRQSQERYRLLVEGAKDYAMVLLDADGCITSWNAGAERIMGWQEADVLGESAELIFTPEDRADGVPTRELRRAEADGRATNLRWHITREGMRFYADGITEALRGDDGALRGFALVLRDATERRALEEARERLAGRERRIAAQLQDALQPAPPESVPGLALASHYEAALAEAGVGGDFYDVFPVEKGCTAIVVGDLSGKGLAAAAQVATVRNMLRAFLYTRPTVAEALSELNDVLADNGLLSGFTTLFVGAYDAGNRTLSYVNCGQEPALVRRAAGGGVEPLMSTGPILGSIAGAVFTESVVTLAPGDAVAVFTDGLTEIGPSRLEMLGIEGVVALLAAATPPPDAAPAARAAFLARTLIAGVDAAARDGVMRDDVCLLVVVAE